MAVDQTSKSTGCLYGIGVGPGDPELLTLKALRILQQVPLVCVPQGRGRTASIALSIVQQFLDEGNQEIIRAQFPTSDEEAAAQVWRDTADTISEHLKRGNDVAFITEGDPMLYSTFAYVMNRVRSTHPEIAIEIVPGVSSVTAAAASAGVPLAAHGERLAVLPAAYGIDDLSATANKYDTTVLMKVNRDLLDSIADLEDHGLGKGSVYVRRATTHQERIVTDLEQLSIEDLDYFSVLIIKR